ncbi:MAG: PIG-L family deacetylase [Planctomycetaceae bacterium]|nr:PIG-L family deacetylase [Planctomycetaceae bacterium]
MSTHSHKRVLAIHAHPDDLEFQCAGTLALLKQRGCEVLMATMTAGDLGSAELEPAEISKIRRGEAAKSAELLGAEYQCLDFSDLSICFDNESRHRVAEAIRRANPDLVITAPPMDYMSDHEMTCRLVRDACFNASVPNYSTRQWDPAPPLKKIPHLYYVDPIEGVDYYGKPIQPEFIVDISATFELKQQMLACHDSQRAWLRQQHGIDEYLESCRRWSETRGREINVAYGEAFTQHKGHPYPGDNLLVEILQNS